MKSGRLIRKSGHYDVKDNKFPKSFLLRMQNQLADDYDHFFNALNSASSVSVRINPLKSTNIFDKLDQIPWCSYGRYLNSRPDFVFDPLIHIGAYYVQDASSMFFANAIDFSKNLKILDTCASPGGKSTLMLSLMTKESFLFCNELVHQRATVLYENIVKWGYPNVIVTSNNLKDYADFKGYFDVILADVPCSGEGMFRKNKRAVQEWNDKKPYNCSVVQKNIIDDSLALLKPGGLFIYSTCSFSPEENEDNIYWFYKKYKSQLSPYDININNEWNISVKKITHFDGKNQNAYYLYPHLVKGEGQFVCFFYKDKIGTKTLNIHHGGNYYKKPEKKIAEKALSYFSQEISLSLQMKDNNLFALPVNYLPEIELAEKKLKVIKAGIHIGAYNKLKDEFIPSHDLAMSNLINNNVNSVNLTREEALQYLSKISVIPEEYININSGWILAKYMGLALGWMKKSGDKINNFFPKNWKIRKNYLHQIDNSEF